MIELRKTEPQILSEATRIGNRQYNFKHHFQRVHICHDWTWLQHPLNKSTTLLQKPLELCWTHEAKCGSGIMFPLTSMRLQLFFSFQQERVFLCGRAHQLGKLEDLHNKAPWIRPTFMPYYSLTSYTEGWGKSRGYLGFWDKVCFVVVVRLFWPSDYKVAVSQR